MLKLQCSLSKLICCSLSSILVFTAVPAVPSQAADQVAAQVGGQLVPVTDPLKTETKTTEQPTVAKMPDVGDSPLSRVADFVTTFPAPPAAPMLTSKVTLSATPSPSATPKPSASPSPSPSATPSPQSTPEPKSTPKPTPIPTPPVSNTTPTPSATPNPSGSPALRDMLNLPDPDASPSPDASPDASPTPKPTPYNLKESQEKDLSHRILKWYSDFIDKINPFH